MSPDRMISFKEAFAKLDKQEQRFQAALDAYLAAISGIGKYAVDVAPELTRDFRLNIEALHAKASGSPFPEALAQSRATLIRALEDYQSRAAGYVAGREENLRAMLGSLAEAARTISGYNDRHSLKLKKFTEHLQIISRGADLSWMRKELAEAVQDLRETQEEISGDNTALVAGLHRQLDEFQERLELSERRAFKDSLTGLLNRGEGEARLSARMKEGQALTVILVDLDDFKQINDRFGHASGDQVLRTVALILTNSFRPPDIVCRWGGDEFLAIFSRDQAITAQRVIQLYEQLNFRCKLVILRKIHEVEVSASLGVADTTGGETADELVARADADLYRQKLVRKEQSSQKLLPMAPLARTDAL